MLSCSQRKNLNTKYTENVKLIKKCRPKTGKTDIRTLTAVLFRCYYFRANLPYSLFCKSSLLVEKNRTF